jgi:hypothetical protein
VVRGILDNKKGDFISTLYVIVTLFAILLIIFVYRDLFGKINRELDAQFSADPQFNNTEAHIAIQSIESKESSAWDYGVLGIVVGYVLALIISSYLTRINIFFYWIYGILSIFGVFISVVVSNLWQGFVSDPEFATTLSQFPITDALLGTYYPTFALLLGVIVMIMLFGKSPEGNQ